jgi:uroporphyrin-III C-methyltransferase
MGFNGLVDVSSDLQQAMEPASVQVLLKAIGRSSGKGLSQEQALFLYRQILDGLMSPMQIGAALMALRVRGESLPEVLGALAAAEPHITRITASPQARVVVIPSYNGARLQPNLVPLLACLLADDGLSVLVHGVLNDAGRLTSAEIFHALGIEPIVSAPGLCELVAQRWSRGVPAFVHLDALSPALGRLLAYRREMGVRNTGHTLAKLLQPVQGAQVVQLASYTHAEFRSLQQDVFKTLRVSALQSRGCEGEVVASTKRVQAIDWICEGNSACVLEAAELGPMDASVLPPAHDADTIGIGWRNTRTQGHQSAGGLHSSGAERRSEQPMKAGLGRVTLIGAGPGDPELLTLKAARLISEADVILVDDLVNRAVLLHARAGVRLRFVGKRGGCRSTPQSFINRLMAHEARKGHQVVRLKGGDALIFGRANEEIDFLRTQGIAVDLVAGITSAQAAGMALGRSLTDRVHSHALVLVTGHPAKEASSADQARINYAVLAQQGMTLVFYMGVARCEAIQQELLGSGLAPELPAAVIERASYPDARVLRCTLGALSACVSSHAVQAPALLVLGEVAALQASDFEFSGATVDQLLATETPFDQPAHYG